METLGIPRVSMQALDNPEPGSVAREVQAGLERVIEAL